MERRLEFNAAQAQASASSNTLTFAPNGIASSATTITVCRDTDASNGYLIQVQRSGAIKMQAQGVDVPANCEVE